MVWGDSSGFVSETPRCRSELAPATRTEVHMASDLSPEAAPDELLTASEAAHQLGIHRSSLYLAVKNRLIVPDYLTPGGHTRFTRATVEAYRSRISRTRPATSQSTLLRKLSHAINAPTGGSQGLRESLQELRHVVPEATVLFVMEHVPFPQTLPAVRLVAELSEPEHAVATFLEHYPDPRLTFSRVLLTGEMVLYQDMAHEPVHDTGSALLARQTHSLAMCVLPLLSDDEILGTLTVGSRQAGVFGAGLLLTLQEMGRELAVLLAYQHQRDLQQAFTLAVGDYLQEVMKPSLDDEMTPQGNLLLETVVQAFRAVHGATDVFVKSGRFQVPPCSLLGRRLLRAAHSRPMVARQWRTPDGPYSGLVIRTVEPPRVMVGAVWAQEEAVSAEQEAALYALAAICLS